MKNKILFILLLCAVIVCRSALAVTRNVQDNHQLIYHVLDASGNHVSGQSVTLKIKRVSDGAWLDFNDMAFKASGWTAKSTTLSEDTTEGYYYYTYNPPSSETGADQYLFVVDNASATYGDHQSQLVSYQDIGSSDFDSASQQVTVATNNDKTGYTIAGTKTTLDALNDIAAADVWSVATRTITGGTIDTNNDKAGYALSAAGIDAVWDEPQSGHTTSGTFGYYLDARVSSAGGGGLTEAGIAAAVWDEDLSGHTTAGSAGKKLSDIPLSGTGDWTSAEKANILEALSVEDGSVATEADLDGILARIKKSRGR